MCSRCDTAMEWTKITRRREDFMFTYEEHPLLVHIEPSGSSHVYYISESGYRCPKARVHINKDGFVAGSTIHGSGLILNEQMAERFKDALASYLIEQEITK